MFQTVSVLTLTCPTMIVPDVRTGWNNTTACTTVITLITMLAENVAKINIFRFRPSFTLRKNTTGSPVKSTSPIPSAINRRGVNVIPSVCWLRVLTDGLGDNDLFHDETTILEADFNSLTDETEPCGSERGTDTDGDPFQRARRL